ncbi:MAG: universal stress protein [Nitrosopumilus sp.]|nr:universal stress protein [Nitrosopumilus sp.]MBT3574046.1 universal stress protein [Nitrosopumilus sp.]MBT3861308.1 universal stress protein [Nitrosopumilus sp.]MBT3956003.1 universal stress protein [Nitrosopumilus sp.]MBT4298599.1 universal stress protein [Nitrosopumilus sp.]
MITKIKKILVALDGSPNSFRGLDAAINLARYCHATITGTYVLEIVKPQVNEQISSSEKILLEHAQKIMKKAKLKSAQHGILFFDKIVYGDSGRKIVDIAQRNNFDLIVISSRGMGSLKEIFLGSTSNHVLHKSKKPVLIVK